MGQQKQEFRDGLRAFNALYVHQYTTSIKLKGTPPHVLRTYDEAGWTLCESCLINTKCTFNSKLTFDEGSLDFEADGALDPLRFLTKFSFPQSSPPLTPDDFVEKLDSNRARLEARDLSLFTSGKDCEMVPDLYRSNFNKFVREANTFAYDRCNWNDLDVIQI